MRTCLVYIPSYPSSASLGDPWDLQTFGGGCGGGGGDGGGGSLDGLLLHSVSLTREVWNRGRNATKTESSYSTMKTDNGSDVSFSPGGLRMLCLLLPPWLLLLVLFLALLAPFLLVLLYNTYALALNYHLGSLLLTKTF